MKRFLLLASLLITTCASLNAQPTAKPATFTLLSAVGTYVGLKYELSPKNLQTVTLNQSTSGPYTQPKGGNLTLFREIPAPKDAPPNTPPTRDIILSTTLPADSPNCMVICLRPAANPTAKLTAYILKNSPTHVAGTLRIVNLSSFPSAVSVNKDKYMLAVGETQTVPAGPSTEPVFIYVTLNKNGRWTPPIGSDYRIAKELRGTMLIFDYIQDPDYEVISFPPPLVTKTFFSISPEIAAERKRKAAEAAGQ